MSSVGVFVTNVSYHLLIYAIQLESLLYELHTLSFLLSPSVWIFISRISSQFQFSKPRNVDSNRSLRFWFSLVLLFNLGAVWGHAQDGAAQGRSIILDFVGMGMSTSIISRSCQFACAHASYHYNSIHPVEATTVVPRLLYHIPRDATHDNCIRNILRGRYAT